MQGGDNEGGGTEYVYSEDSGTMGVVETHIDSGGAPGESTVVASTGNSGEPAEAGNDNSSDGGDPYNH